MAIVIPQSTRRRSQYFTVNGTAIYEPDNNVKVTHESLADSESGRTRDGIMHINWVRTNMRKFNLTYSILTNEEYQLTADLLQGKIFTFGYIENGISRTMTAYCSNHSYDNYLHDDVSKRGLYQNFQINIIEV